MPLSSLLYKMYGGRGIVRKLTTRLICRLEGGEYYSQTLRRIFKDYHGVEIGLYSHGGCFVPGQFDRFTSIGRYCSMAKSLRAMNRNHPLEYKSMHGFFFNPALKYCSEDKINYIPLKIGNDVWIGHSAIIMPNVKNIADGAVVNKDILPYAVAVDNPARVVRFRFSKEIIEELIASRWWERSIKEIGPRMHEYQRPFE